MIKHLGFLILFLSVTLAISCNTQEQKWKGTVEEVNGVTVVKNPKQPIYKTDVLEIKKDLTIGEAEGREEYMFSELKKVTVDNKGRIYALDTKASNVKVYTDQGKYVRTIGRRGVGPGELQMPALALISPRNELLVLEMMKISYFTLDGEFIKSLNLSSTGIIQINFDKFGNMFGMRYVRGGENRRLEMGRMNPEFKLISAFDSSPISMTPSSGFNPFSSFLKWDMVQGEKVVCGYAAEGYKFRMYDLNGKLIKIIQKDYDPERVTDRDIEIEMRKNGIMTRKEISAPEYKPPFQGIYIDDKGRMYVSTWEYVPQLEGYTYDVFDAEGRYLVKTAIRGEPQIFQNGKLYLIVQDEAGYQLIQRCKVTWKIPAVPEQQD